MPILEVPVESHDVDFGGKDHLLLSLHCRPSELHGLPGVSQATMAYQYMPDSPANATQVAASTVHAPVIQVTDETAAQQILELKQELALERGLHHRTRENLAGMTIQRDEVLVEPRA